MIVRRFVAALGALLFLNIAHAATVLDDDFPGTGAEPAGWSKVTVPGSPLSSGSVSHAGSIVTIDTTVAPFPGNFFPTLITNAAVFDPQSVVTTISAEIEGITALEPQDAPQYQPSLFVSRGALFGISDVGVTGVSVRLNHVGELSVLAGPGGGGTPEVILGTVAGYSGGPIDVTAVIDATGFRVTTNTGFDSGSVPWSTFGTGFELCDLGTNVQPLVSAGRVTVADIDRVVFTTVAGTPASCPGNDDDGDGVPNDQDICPGGDDNVNTDGDSVPDFCDVCPFDADNDADGDGVCGDVDVCPIGDDNVDADFDSTPDACDVCPFDADNDADGDGVCGDVDNCPIVANDNQADTDGDNVGDACDFDDDNDNICDGSDAVSGICDAGPDNCPLDANNDQSDFDGDGAGDVCDSDDDNDNVADNVDACPMTVTGEIIDADGCSIADLCPCENNWKNHGAYVRCVAHTAQEFEDAGLISETEKGDFVSAAGNSSCGHKN